MATISNTYHFDLNGVYRAVIHSFLGIFPYESYPIFHLEKAGLDTLPVSLVGDLTVFPEGASLDYDGFNDEG